MGVVLVLVVAIAMSGCDAPTCEDLQCPPGSWCLAFRTGAECRCPAGTNLSEEGCVAEGAARPITPADVEDDPPDDVDDGRDDTWDDGSGDCGGSTSTPDVGVEGHSEHTFAAGCDVDAEWLPLDLAAVDLGRGPAVQARDVDGDSLPDIVAMSSPTDIAVCWNAGNGTFSDRTVLPLESRPSGSPLLFDLDRDGSLALAVPGDSLVIYSVDAAVRALVPRGSYLSGQRPMPLATADLDGDGRADLVVQPRDSADAVILFAAGGTRHLDGAPSGLGLRWVMPRDADGDGDLDLHTSAGVSLNDGAGHFAPPERTRLDMEYPVAADLDLDGVPDAFWSEERCSDGCCGVYECSYRLGVAVGTEAGRLPLLSERDIEYTGGAYSDPLRIFAIDLDGDRFVDVGWQLDGTIHVLPNDGEGNLGAPLAITVPAEGTGVAGIAAADFDRSGRQDILIAGPERSAILLSPCPARELATIVAPPRAGQVPGPSL